MMMISTLLTITVLFYKTFAHKHVGVLSQNYQNYFNVSDIPVEITKLVYTNDSCNEVQLNKAFEYVEEGGTIWLSPGHFTLCDSLVFSKNHITVRGVREEDEVPVLFPYEDLEFHMVTMYDREGSTLMDVNLLAVSPLNFNGFTQENYLGLDVKNSEYTQVRQVCFLLFEHYAFRLETVDEVGMVNVKIVGQNILLDENPFEQEQEEPSRRRLRMNPYIYDSLVRLGRRLMGTDNKPTDKQTRRLQEEEVVYYGNGGKMKDTKNVVIKDSLFVKVPDYGLRLYGDEPNNENVWIVNTYFVKCGRTETENIRAEYVTNLNLVSNLFMNCKHALKTKYGEGLNAIGNQVFCTLSGVRVEGTRDTSVMCNALTDLEGDSGTVVNILPKPKTETCQGATVRLNTACTLQEEERPFKVCDGSDVSKNNVFKYNDDIQECYNPFQDTETLPNLR